MITSLEMFKGHKELMLNISRVLSKLSIDQECAKLMINQAYTLINVMHLFKENSPFLIRIAFVLGNVTTHYQQAR